MAEYVIVDFELILCLIFLKVQVTQVPPQFVKLVSYSQFQPFGVKLTENEARCVNFSVKKTRPSLQSTGYKNPGSNPMKRKRSRTTYRFPRGIIS